MSHGKQFTLFTHKGGPNGWRVLKILQLQVFLTISLLCRKVALIFEELGLSYESVYIEFDKMKEPEYTKYNPNGRIPAIIDHKNNDFVLWYVPPFVGHCLQVANTDGAQGIQRNHPVSH